MQRLVNLRHQRMRKNLRLPTRPPSKKYLAQIKAQMARQRALADKVKSALLHDSWLTVGEAKEAGFHLTDWLTDLEDLSALFAAKRWNAAKAKKTILNFVVHVPAHLVAAHKAIMGEPVEDVFLLGAVKGSGRAKRKADGPFPEPKRRATAMKRPAVYRSNRKRSRRSVS